MYPISGIYKKPGMHYLSRVIFLPLSHSQVENQDLFLQVVTALNRYPLVASEFRVSKLGFLRSLHFLSSSLLQMQRLRGVHV